MQLILKSLIILIVVSYSNAASRSYCENRFETAFYAFKKVLKYNDMGRTFSAKVEASVYQDALIDIRMKCKNKITGKSKYAKTYRRFMLDSCNAEDAMKVLGLIKSVSYSKNNRDAICNKKEE